MTCLLVAQTGLTLWLLIGFVYKLKKVLDYTIWSYTILFSQLFNIVSTTKRSSQILTFRAVAECSKPLAPFTCEVPHLLGVVTADYCLVVYSLHPPIWRCLHSRTPTHCNGEVLMRILPSYSIWYML